MITIEQVKVCRSVLNLKGYDISEKDLYDTFYKLENLIQSIAYNIDMIRLACGRNGEDFYERLR